MCHIQEVVAKQTQAMLAREVNVSFECMVTVGYVSAFQRYFIMPTPPKLETPEKQSFAYCLGTMCPSILRCFTFGRA
jgi:hypothetical protein